MSHTRDHFIYCQLFSKASSSPLYKVPLSCQTNRQSGYCSPPSTGRQAAPGAEGPAQGHARSQHTGQNGPNAGLRALTSFSTAAAPGMFSLIRIKQERPLSWRGRPAGRPAWAVCSLGGWGMEFDHQALSPSPGRAASVCACDFVPAGTHPLKSKCRLHYVFTLSGCLFFLGPFPLWVPSRLCSWLYWGAFLVTDRANHFPKTNCIDFLRSF